MAFALGGAHPARPLRAGMVSPHALAAAGRGAHPCPRHRQERQRRVTLARRLAPLLAACRPTGDLPRPPRRRRSPAAWPPRRRRVLQTAGSVRAAALPGHPDGGAAGALLAAQLAQPTRPSASRARSLRQRSLPPLLAGTGDRSADVRRAAARRSQAARRQSLAADPAPPALD